MDWQGLQCDVILSKYTQCMPAKPTPSLLSFQWIYAVLNQCEG